VVPGAYAQGTQRDQEIMPKIDMIIEVLDARIPYSSENPLVNELRGDKPCIKLLNKADLADPQVTKLWIDHFQAERNIKASAVSQEQPAQIKHTPQRCSKLFPERNLPARPTRVLIMGIPNVGKSTLMNGLLGRVLAKVGNEPAVTKVQQSTRLANDVLLFDTPGMLWPKVEDEDSGYRLAMTGAIKNTAMEFEDVALYAANYFLEYYPELIMARYKLKQLPEDDISLLEEIGRRRGALRPGGHIDINKASELLISEFRSGAIGRISLETPEMVAAKKAMQSMA